MCKIVKSAPFAPSLRQRFALNAHPVNAWYVAAYNRLPNIVRPWYCESARVGSNMTSFCRFGWKVFQRGAWPAS